MSHLVQFVAGMGICTTGLRLKKLEDLKGGEQIEDADCGVTSLSRFVFYAHRTLHPGRLVASQLYKGCLSPPLACCL